MNFLFDRELCLFDVEFQTIVISCAMSKKYLQSLFKLRDHTPCCLQEGVHKETIVFCSIGNIKKFEQNFQLLFCLHFLL